jgi:hypothetical protein
VAQVQSRGYSRPLQRVITDFSADVAFGQVGEKLKEHYGIRIPEGAPATVTYRHAKALSENDILPQSPPEKAAKTLIAETDGSMIPVVQFPRPSEASSEDKRKWRTVGWKEARLSLARCAEEEEPLFFVTLGHAKEAGAALKRVACAVGLDENTHVHGVGDGAPWIADQMKHQFGENGHYLIDFFHLCEYLSAAAPGCCEAG